MAVAPTSTALNEPADSVLCAKSLTVGFGEATILNDITVNIGRGHATALIGPTVSPSLPAPSALVQGSISPR